MGVFWTEGITEVVVACEGLVYETFHEKNQKNI